MPDVPNAIQWKDLIDLWSRPLPEGEAAVSAFRKFYTDPVFVNGVEMTVASLVERARATQKAFADLQATLVTRIDTAGHTAIVFRMKGRHVGPLSTPLGQVAATGKTVERQVIDVFALKNGLISQIWMVSDDLGALTQLGAVALV